MVFRRIKKNTKKVDKMIKGAVIGGAIGSVVGVSLTKSKKKQTKQPSFLGKIGQKEEKKPKHVTSFLGGMRALVFGKKKK